MLIAHCALKLFSLRKNILLYLKKKLSNLLNKYGYIQLQIPISNLCRWMYSSSIRFRGFNRKSKYSSIRLRLLIRNQCSLIRFRVLIGNQSS